MSKVVGIYDGKSVFARASPSPRSGLYEMARVDVWRSLNIYIEGFEDNAPMFLFGLAFPCWSDAEEAVEHAVKLPHYEGRSTIAPGKRTACTDINFAVLL